MSVVDQYRAPMHRLLFALALGLAVAGCGNGDINPDAAVNPATGCRPPQFCYTTTCGCTRPVNGNDVCKRDCVFQVNVDMPACVCATGDVCIEPSQECVGRAVAPCPGEGARCLPAGSSCASSGGDPPDVVGAMTSGDPDAGPGTEQRCPYVDDVCCPGMIPSTVDLGELDANLDQSIAD
jgi:hypothetical protein